MIHFLFILLFSGTVFAAELPKDIKAEVLFDWSDGLNTAWSKHKLKNTMATNIQNFLIDEKVGSLVKRKGFVVSGSTVGLSEINFFFIFNKEDGSKEYIVSDSSSVYSTKDFTLFTLLRSSLNSTFQLEAAQGRNKIWFTNGNDFVFNYNGTTVTVLDGTNSTPYVPAGKYISFFQERFFVFNTTSNSSALNFSALTSTDGIALAPDDSRAWSVINQINIGQGDGQYGTGLIVDKGQLYQHKNRSIFTLFGTDEFSYFVRKSNADVGTISNDSIVLLDNLQYFLAKDGIYAFDGRDAIRISDFIAPDIESFISNLSRIVQNKWETKSEFDQGIYSGSTFTASLSLSLSSAIVISERNYSLVTATNPVIPGASIQGNVTAQFIPSVGSYVIKEVSFLWLGNTPDGAQSTRMVYRNNRTNESSTVIGKKLERVVGPDILFEVSKTSDSEKVVFSTSDIQNSTMSLTFINFGVDGQTIGLPWTSNGRQGDVILNPLTTGHYTSEITTIPSGSLTSWDRFNAVKDEKGGSINFFVRTATSIVNMTTQTYSGIVSGSIISAPSTNRFIQWSSSMIAAQQTAEALARPSITNVKISHNEGGNSNSRAIGAVWKNRYWLAISTVSDGSTSIIYVKSKNTNANQNAWVKFTGINIKSMSNDGGDVFFGGSSSSGTVFRLDERKNDNGEIIDALYETPDLILGDNFFEKKLVEYMVDFEADTNSNLSLGTSINNGSFTFDTVDTPNSNRVLKTINIKDRDKFGKYFRFRIRNNELDKDFVFNALAILYQPTSNK